MKTKLRRFTAVFSAVLCMICCVLSAVPASALTNSELPTGGYNPEFEERYKTAIAELKSKYPDKFKNYVMMLPYYDSSFDQIGFYWFSCDDSNNFEVYEKDGSYYIKNTDSKPFTSYYIFLNTRTSLFTDLYVSSTSSPGKFDYALSWQIYDSNCKVKFGDKYEFGKSDAPVPAPFTVTYSPELKLNLKRKTSDYETKSIDVTLTLNKDYLDWYIRRYAELLMDTTCGSCDDEDISSILNTELLSSQMDFTDCAKSRCIYFISLSDTSKSLKKVTENSVYTYLSQQKYSIVGKDNGEIDGNTSTAVYANGLYPYFTVDFNDDFKSLGCTSNVTYSKYQNLISDLPSYTFSVPLKNINADKFEIISVLNSILTSETQFNFNKNIVAEGQNQGTFAKTFTEKYNVNTGSNGVSFNNDDNWHNDTLSYADYFNKSDIYNVYSSQFSFDSYPKYVPLKDGQGNDIDMLKSNPFDYSMNPVLPGTYQSVSQDGKLSDERTAEQQKKYDEEVKKAQNFSDVDFGIDGIKSIFDGTSDFYAFLTASIAILPNYFLIILGSFFTIMLAICVVKWLL